MHREVRGFPPCDATKRQHAGSLRLRSEAVTKSSFSFQNDSGACFLAIRPPRGWAVRRSTAPHVAKLVAGGGVFPLPLRFIRATQRRSAGCCTPGRSGPSRRGAVDFAAGGGKSHFALMVPASAENHRHSWIQPALPFAEGCVGQTAGEVRPRAVISPLVCVCSVLKVLKNEKRTLPLVTLVYDFGEALAQ